MTRSSLPVAVRRKSSNPRAVPRQRDSSTASANSSRIRPRPVVTGTPRSTLRATDATTGVVRVRQNGSIADFPYDITLRYRDGSRERRRIVVTEADATFSVTGRMPIDTVEFADELTLVELSR